MDKLKMHSPNLVDANIEKISALFPNCITETKDENGELKKAIDFDLLKQELSQVLVEGEQERYRLDWVGKKEAILTANAPIAKTLRPCREESVNFDKTENLFIEGDNLEALKLLQENYLGKVKMIYIDPPYNTGNDFIYEDDFAESTNVFFERSNQVDEEGNRLIANTESNGRFHSDWLSMIYSRLKLTRNLLKDDGVLFISCDDSELYNLKKILDEVFGSNNFIGNLIIKSNPRGSQSDNFKAIVHEYLLAYVKDSFSAEALLDTLSDDMIKEYNLNDENGNYRLLGLRMRGGSWRREQRPLLFYPFYINPLNNSFSLNKDTEHSIEILPIQPSTGEDGTWRWSKSKVENEGNLLIAKPIVRNGENTWDIFQKDYLHNDEGIKGTKLKTILDAKELNYQNGSVEVKQLFDNKSVFDFPKPKYLIQKILSLVSTNNEIILDFFSGSATTAHAVMQLNAEDNGNRKFIMVQLPEQVDEKKEAFKAGYKTIADVSKDRIRRAGKKILEDNVNKEGIENLDIGFRVLKIDSSNMKDVYYTPDALKQVDMLDLADHIKADRTSEDLLFQVMLDWGIELSLPIERKTIAGKEVFYVAGNSLVACFDELTFDVVDEVAKDHPLRFVSAEKAIHLDHDKTNIKERFKQLSPDTEVKFL
ncbi:site-specific DNA-methyltransferase [Acinetobacter baumannii]|uniref:site-specific DNA-methyltransferase (adenine-specific) n=10 Tax=Acinetobacter baumannii TaxID=470 RepID=A0A0D5YKG5_ACIBA|nr:site-specific DNA-methyltransferase [Acinetobacter baumannii]AKA32712.1 DNA methylase N-4/N-6 [Acinetobacter baumannii]EHU3030040.1 site-specific DNA-methyltransferase [Acinetobacter baumannii]EIB7002275.1 site-specific DNA-methyltransferase [Acinetobacter baumannii]EIB7141002.1 site-specific DNA-methyltransferase [Acinetobacter baumannii]EKA75600.1 DNA methylase family protein [Acinetobacter baumannii IS-58]